MRDNMRCGRRALAHLPAILWMGVIFAGSSLPGDRVSSPFSPFAHFIEYAVLAALLFAWPSIAERPLHVAVAISLVLAIAYGVSDEFHQAFIPGRVPSAGDVLVDASGAFAGALLAALYKKKAARGRPS